MGNVPLLMYRPDPVPVHRLILAQAPDRHDREGFLRLVGRLLARAIQHVEAQLPAYPLDPDAGGTP